MKELHGTGVALVTPFSTSGAVDYEGLKNLLDFTAKHVDYWVVMGTTGETATCTAEEKAQILSFCKENNPSNLPIVYGIGGNNTQGVIDTIKHTDLEGVEAILSVSPYYNKPSQAGIIAHFTAIADASPVPVILYNVPGRTGSNMLASTTLELAKHPNIIGIKEAVGEIAQCEAIAKDKPADFMLISGEDPLTPAMIKLGAVGAISVLANGFPAEFCQSINEGLAGNHEESQRLMDAFEKINPLMYAESNPVGVKEVLRLKGVCGNQVRLPLLPATAKLSEAIEAEML